MTPTKSLMTALLFAVALNCHAQSNDAPRASGGPSALDSALFYQLLVGELQARNGEPGPGYALILDAARKTNDARLYQRAVDIALQSRSGDSALLAARAWKQAFPASREANRFVLQILIGLNRIGDTLEPLKREIALADTKDRAATIALIPRYFAPASDRALSASVVEQALGDHLNNAALGSMAWTVIGRMRLQAANPGAALEAAQKAQALESCAVPQTMLALSLMEQKTPRAEDLVKVCLATKPRPELRMEYARILLESLRHAEARDQLLQVTVDKPEMAQAWLILGVLELQDNQTDKAEKSFQRFVTLYQAEHRDNPTAASNRGLTQAYLSLAQIAEQRRDFKQAETWLSQIDNSEELFAVQTRRAGILARQGQLEDARALITGLPERTPADARYKISAEVQLLRDAKLFAAAYEVLAKGLQRDPGDLDLTYDLAMVAEKLGRFDEMEQLLRSVIKGKPDYHHAYNALGYSLADRKVRLVEARQLILKALEHAPGDPLITDSLGWAEFRLGNLPEALRLLQSAFKAKPDAEIAAHLGELLWNMGRRDAAMSVWREGAAISADNETLQGTLKRLRVKL